MKLLARILVIPLLFLGFTSCDDNNDNNNGSSNITYKATLNGASEVPANSSTATGNATLNYNDDTNIMTMTVTYSGLTVTDAHIHKGAVGVDGDVVFPLVVTASPINYTSPALNATQEADLKAGMYYVNLHTAANPGGEIRGQLLPQSSNGGGGY
jgi:hypothetical protein